MRRGQRRPLRRYPTAIFFAGREASSESNEPQPDRPASAAGSACLQGPAIVSCCVVTGLCHARISRPRCNRKVCVGYSTARDDRHPAAARQCSRTFEVPVGSRSLKLSLRCWPPVRSRVLRRPRVAAATRRCRGRPSAPRSGRRTVEPCLLPERESGGRWAGCP